MIFALKRSVQTSTINLVMALIFFAGVTGACQPPANPSANFTRGEVLLREDFSSTFDWDDRQQGVVQIGAEDGAYRMRSNSNNYVRGFNNQVHDNVLIEVETLQVTPQETNAYGIICRASTSDMSSNGYYFLIGGDGSYSIRKGRGGNIEPLINWSHTDALNEGVARNVIRVLCIDDYLALYINGEFIAEAFDDSFQSGFLGFALATREGTTTEVAFDNLTVWSAERED